MKHRTSLDEYIFLREYALHIRTYFYLISFRIYLFKNGYMNIYLYKFLAHIIPIYIIIFFFYFLFFLLFYFYILFLSYIILFTSQFLGHLMYISLIGKHLHYNCTCTCTFKSKPRCKNYANFYLAEELYLPQLN